MPLARALTAQNQANCNSIRPGLRRTGPITIFTSWPSFVTNSSSSQPRSAALFRRSPPERPRLRKRWFKNLLQEAATLRCTSSKGRCNPRMVKRRHSPYASHDPSKLPGRHLDYSPALLGPMPLSSKTKFAITC